MKHNIKVGCSGFYYRNWQGVFYPNTLKPNEWFKYYSTQFSTLEINSTFYHFPLLKTMQGWYDKSPEEFTFSVKAPKSITHIKKLNECKELITDFYAVCKEGLKNKLGCVLFQLPPGFTFTRERLQQVTENLNPNFKNVVEFRHASWWTETVFKELEKHGITFCSVNHPQLPSAIVINTPLVYIRLHGNPVLFYSSYSVEQLNEIYKPLLETHGIKEAFIYFNNTAGIAGFTNARQVLEIAARHKTAVFHP